MKIAFEYWIEENIKREETKNILYEAVICYKNSTNRAALLLSYIAFVDIIKHRLLESPKPPQVLDGDWQQNKKLLSDDDECDKKVFEILNRADNKYFKISDSIRNQIRYWKDRRNDCAHLKENKIDAAHVESFWLFLSSNLNRIVVVGSGQDLVNRIKMHFNESYTPMDKDPLYLINEIPNSVELIDFENFLAQVKEVITKSINDNWFYIGEDANFFFSMLKTLNGGYFDIIKNYIYQNSDIALEMFACCPEFLSYYKNDKPQFIREMWKNRLGREIGVHKIACSLLRHALIPDTEIGEFIQECVYKNNNNIPNEKEYAFLKSYGYIDKISHIINEAIKKNGEFKWWIEKNPRFIEFYIKFNIKNKNLSFIDTILCSEIVEDNKIIEAFYKIISNNEELLEVVKKRSIEVNVALDELLFIYG